jgi:type IV secretion system protein VirB4
MGFDVTEFLDHALTRAPITLYLFHLVRQLLDGRRLVCWMDEFWRLLADPAFESFAKDGPKTWRKLNGGDVSGDAKRQRRSRQSHQPHPGRADADQDFLSQCRCQFRGVHGRLRAERARIRLMKDQLEPGSRMFLVKQSHHSVVCQLDLKGFDSELAVISGRASEVARMNRLMAESGPDPAAWLPGFMGMEGDARQR